MTDTQYKPGTYVKGDATRYVTSARQAVQAEFDGFKRQEDLPKSVVAAEENTVAPGDELPEDYRELQEVAKSLDIPANQSAEALREAINEARA